MISAPSKPLKLKLAGQILYGETRLRTKGFCSAPLRSRDISDKVRNGILALFRDQLYFSATKQRRTKSFGTHVHNTSNNTSTKLQLQRIKLHIEIINVKPVTPTTILLRHGSLTSYLIPNLTLTLAQLYRNTYTYSDIYLCNMFCLGLDGLSVEKANSKLLKGQANFNTVHINTCKSLPFKLKLN